MSHVTNACPEPVRLACTAFKASPSAFVASAMRGMSRSHDRHSSIKHPCSSILENLCCSSTQKSSSLLLPAAQKFLRKTQNPQKFKKNLSPKEA